MTRIGMRRCSANEVGGSPSGVVSSGIEVGKSAARRPIHWARIAMGRCSANEFGGSPSGAVSSWIGPLLSSFSS